MKDAMTWTGAMIFSDYKEMGQIQDNRKRELAQLELDALNKIQEVPDRAALKPEIDGTHTAPNLASELAKARNLPKTGEGPATKI